MILKIDKELFQWEKERYVFINDEDLSLKPECVQFYNKKVKLAPEVPIIDGKAKIPNSLLMDCLPIVALACIKVDEESQVVSRREFKVLARKRPENYVEEDTVREIIYDGGMEI